LSSDTSPRGMESDQSLAEAEGLPSHAERAKARFRRRAEMARARRPKIAVVNYGVGNLWSIANGLRRVGAEPRLLKHLVDLPKFDAVVLPGAGAFKPATAFLEGQRRDVEEAVARGQPLLCVCLGMQLLFDESEEGGLNKGSGFIHGKVRRLPATMKIPHMGWNQLAVLRQDAFLEGIRSGDYFSFAHSYYPSPEEPSVVLASTEHGVSFPSVVAKSSIYGTQFHPEKSGEKGLRILRNLVKIVQERAA